LKHLGSISADCLQSSAHMIARKLVGNLDLDTMQEVSSTNT